jgi:hypothetical protein
MSNIEHFPDSGTFHYAVVKTKGLTLKQILSMPCPTCGVATGEPCELHTGALRTEPHRDRRLDAAEAVTKTWATLRVLKSRLTLRDLVGRKS